MILALDTATTTASFALYDPLPDRGRGTLLAEQTWQARRRQTEELLPALRTLMDRLGIARTDIDAIAVTTGPGSFTGVRIAISMAKGMALGLPTPPNLIGVPTLSVTAAPWLQVANAASPGGRPQIWAFIQAGRERYNWSAFSSGDLLCRPKAEEHAVGKADKLEAALSAHSGPIWLVGEVTQVVEQVASRMEHVQLIDGISGLRRAGQLARLAVGHLAAGNVDSVDTLAPLYLHELS